MSQSIVAGIILIIFGLILEGKPEMIWRAAEKWKSKEAKGPSAIFNLITKILGGVYIVIGILLLIGILR